jgi:hypothetical protein
MKLHVKLTQRENKMYSNLIAFCIPAFFNFNRMDLYLSLYRSNENNVASLLQKMCTLKELKRRESAFQTEIRSRYIIYVLHILLKCSHKKCFAAESEFSFTYVSQR